MPEGNCKMHNVKHCTICIAEVERSRLPAEFRCQAWNLDSPIIPYGQCQNRATMLLQVTTSAIVARVDVCAEHYNAEMDARRGDLT